MAGGAAQQWCAEPRTLCSSRHVDGRLAAAMADLRRPSLGGLVSAIAVAAVAEARAIAVAVTVHAPSAAVEPAPTSAVAGESPAAADATKTDLYNLARKADVTSRSTMTKSELRRAVVNED
jgi:hypothetical protein